MIIIEAALFAIAWVLDMIAWLELPKKEKK
jgi:hypothetical protein